MDLGRWLVGLVDRSFTPHDVCVPTAKTGFGVTELFERVAREVVARGTAREERPQQGQIRAPAASSSLYGSLCCST